LRRAVERENWPRSGSDRPQRCRRRNIEIVRRAFAFGMQGRGDPVEALEDFDPDVVLNSFEEPPSRGRSAVRDNFERWQSAWEEVEATAEEFIDAGDPG
jgi:ketosteroid isomerase-like protein